MSHLALHATRRAGAATAVALMALAAHALAVAVYRLLLPPGPALAAHLLLVPAAVGLDAWYALSTKGEATATTRRGGALFYGLVFLAVALPYMAGTMALPVLDATTALASVAAGLPAALIASLLGARIGAWLAELGRPRASGTARPRARSMAAAPGSPRTAELETAASASPTATAHVFGRHE